MDPDAVLAEQLRLAGAMLADHHDSDGNGVDRHDAAELASLVIELDEWITKGGFLPKAWQKKE
jgi:hypothetical protein